jgi:hypothetical protein
MKTKEIEKLSEVIIDNRPKIRIKLDYKTTITVRSMDSYKIWKDKYPEAILIEQLKEQQLTHW